MEFNPKTETYTLTLSGDLTDKAGKVKVVARNNGGEVTSEADLTVGGVAPEFKTKPIKCVVLEGWTIWRH